MNTEKRIQTIERWKLLRTIWDATLSDITIEKITQIIERTRIEKGHVSAEAVAKEIRLLIESGISEEELLDKLDQIEPKEKRT